MLLWFLLAPLLLLVMLPMAVALERFADLGWQRDDQARRRLGGEPRPWNGDD
ncbi:MAG: hypothetical protein ACXWMU_05760 [Candidatus Limnocylindrales bacterium]